MKNVSLYAPTKLVALNVRERNLGPLKGPEVRCSGLCLDPFLRTFTPELWGINPCEPDRDLNILTKPDPSTYFDRVSINHTRKCCRDRPG